MLYLLYLESRTPHQLVGALKGHQFDVHIAADLDDLLDRLWFHGANVAAIVVETARPEGLTEFFDAILDWPKLPVLVFGPLDETLGQGRSNLRFEKEYSVQRVTRDLTPKAAEFAG